MSKLNIILRATWMVLACLLPAPLLAADAPATVQQPEVSTEDKPASVSSFQRDAYKNADIDAAYEIDTQAATNVSPGMKVWSPPKKIRFTATLLSYPESCDPGNLGEVLAMSGVDLQSMPKISTCIRIKTAKDLEVTAFTQDLLGEPLHKEIRIGEQVELYAAYVYANEISRNLGIIVSEFKQPQAGAQAPEETAKAIQPGSTKEDKTHCLELKSNAEIAACAAGNATK